MLGFETTCGHCGTTPLGKGLLLLQLMMLLKSLR
jgi:hypothetical protein